jgi:hypothetical protein
LKRAQRTHSICLLDPVWPRLAALFRFRQEGTMKRRFALPVVLAGCVSAPWAAAQVPAGGEFQVNTSAYPGWYPSVAADSAGNFTVVWFAQLSLNQHRVDGQRYDASGAPLGAEFQVNSNPLASFMYPHNRPGIAADGSGNFVVVWASTPDIFGQRFDASGAPLGGEFQVNTNAAGPYPTRASVASMGFDETSRIVPPSTSTLMPSGQSAL